MKELKNAMKTYRKVKRYSNKVNRTVNMFSKPSKSFFKAPRVTYGSTKKVTNKKPVIYGSTPVDHMTGSQFEQYLADLYSDYGYRVQKTDHTGDFGADLILDSEDGRSVVQAKRYSQKVGIRAIQEISAAKKYYIADRTLVITNNYFTKAAIELAQINDVILINRNDLIRLISKREERSAEIKETQTIYASETRETRMQRRSKIKEENVNRTKKRPRLWKRFLKGKI